MTAPTTHRPPSVEQLHRPRSRGKVLLAAAAAVVVAAGTGVMLSNGDEERALPPAQPPVEEPQRTESTVLTGLRDVPDFPIRMTVPSSLQEDDQDPGTRAFSMPGESGGIFVTALRSVGGTGAADLPADVTTVLSTRPDLVVTKTGTATVDGRTAQSFSIGVAPNMRPYDVWCPIEEELCFKLEVGKPMDVLVVPTEAAPLWIGVEYSPRSKQAITAVAEQLIASIDLDS